MDNRLGWCMACKVPLMMENVINDGAAKGGRHVAVLECPQCGRQGMLEFGSKEFAAHRERDRSERRARGAAVGYFRRVLNDVEFLDDIIEWENLEGVLK